MPIGQGWRLKRKNAALIIVRLLCGCVDLRQFIVSV